MKISVPPLVFAAALGFLGPAALEDSEDGDGGVAGLWKRALTPPDPDAAPIPAGALGERIEVVQVENRVLLDDGSGTLSSDVGTWTIGPDGPDHLVNVLEVAGAHVVREFALDGDNLTVEVRIERDGVTAERWSTSYERVTDLS